MGRRHIVEQLDDTQFDFVVRLILAGRTDREICADFEAKFKEASLGKSSLHRWRKAAGNELAERYRLKRFQARTFVEQLKDEGIEVKEDKYKSVIENLEDHLLTAERELIAQNPAKLLLARQREENFRLKRDQLELKKQELAFEREKFERTQNIAADRLKIGGLAWQFILSFLLKKEPAAVDALTRHSDEILDGLGEYLEQNQAA